MSARPTLKELVYRVLDEAVKVPFVKSYVLDYMVRHPKKCIKSVRRYTDRYAYFSEVKNWPEDIRAFDRLSFLFHSSQANYGLCLLEFEEAAYLYRLAAGIRNGRIAEIGRFKGGSTFLIAAAMDESVVLDSYDSYEAAASRPGSSKEAALEGVRLDEALVDALKRYGLDSRVNLFIQDSAQADLAGQFYDVVFVDGDHSYDGARRDFLKWHPALKKGGHLIFHDAAKQGRFSISHTELERLAAEIENGYSREYKRIVARGSLAHFKKEGEPVFAFSDADSIDRN